ncbi:type IX secretion system membrane protein PorP/SprF [Maribellus sp. YY47]|uniref:PorP/SprF family type IX secretion system membrane protein n=1 Tax=Maribellus sp. YY47 TaxID=2929486 RepID=UPI00200066B2|nr:type IX secretion system membrane protein PorP/SprF [Maribellus sp. YY47]MCK3686346.1 type IX secretion system membrane protein PorP/SprF [Maribellus sp. YY47]
MKKTVSFLYLLLMVHMVVFAQQDPQYTNHMYYKLGTNPGYAGSEDAISGILLNRYQWAGFGGGEPVTMVFSVNAPVKAFGAPGGIGINIVRDQLGYNNNMWINFNYAYKVTTGLGTLGIGVSPGFYNYNISPEEWSTPDGINGGGGTTGGDTGDNSIPSEETSQLAFDVGLGAYLYSRDYYLGISASHLNQAAVKYDEVEVYYLARHYYVMGGYNIKLSDPLFQLRPSFLLKSDIAGWQLDLNANVVYNDKFWGGLSYRVQDALAFLMGVELFNGLRVGYAFDLTTSAIGRNTLGSHEFFVGYSINLERSRSQKYKSIRFL